ncbi:MAG: Hsp70 family protein [Bradymonadaceae bacterium]
MQQKVRDYFGRDPVVDINPDEVVSVGAAIFERLEGVLVAAAEGGDVRIAHLRIRARRPLDDRPETGRKFRPKIPRRYRGRVARVH